MILSYPDIKHDILECNNKLGSIVSIDDHDYSHQPDIKEVVHHISIAIEALTILRDKLQ